MAMLVRFIGVAAYIFVGRYCLGQLSISLYGSSGGGPVVFRVLLARRVGGGRRAPFCL